MRSRRSPLGRFCLGAALWCVAFAALGSATLYKWVDADGVTHYSDRPEPGAQKVKIAAAQTYKGDPRPAAVASQPPPGSAAAGSYKRLEITSPEDGAVLWNIGGQLEIAATLEPDLVSGHQLWFVVDGKSQQAQGGTLAIDVGRGSHTVTASVTDASGNEMITSAPITFIVRQTSAAQAPQGPSLPPKPKPHD